MIAEETHGEGASMDKAQARREKEARYEEYCKTYAEQLRFQGYISSLEKDNENIRDSEITTNRAKRRAKKLVKINNKDIKKYNRVLKTLPPIPPFE